MAYTVENRTTPEGAPPAREATDAGRFVLRHAKLCELDPTEASELVEVFGRIGVAAITPGVPPSESWVAEDWAARKDAIRREAVAQWAVAPDGAVVGFIVYRNIRVAGDPVLHLMAASVLPEYQGHGLAFAINARIIFRELVRHPFGHLYMAAHILNPVALAGWRCRVKNPRSFYPQLTPTAPRPNLARAARAFAAEVDRGLPFDPSTGVVRHRHPPGQRSTTASGNPAVDDLYSEHVCWESGDTVLMMVDLGHRSVVLEGIGELLRAAPRALLVMVRSRRSGRKRG